MVRADLTKLVLDATKELRSFRLAMTFPMGAKRGTGRGAFIDRVTEAVGAEDGAMQLQRRIGGSLSSVQRFCAGTCTGGVRRG